ncbi:MAG: hypothetical protein JHC33_04795 [Ignisphaera sp.]|nr:hypothetical protein [Ignisphaera sp.]
MHDDQEVFTITLIADGSDSKLLLSTSETPAKEDSEASGVIYKEDLPEQFEEIVSKIPIFRDAEDGSEESITHTTNEFLDLYELDLLDLIEKGEEILHVDLDDDDESEEGEEHKELVEPDEFDATEGGPEDIFASSDDALSHIDPREALDNY